MNNFNIFEIFQNLQLVKKDDVLIHKGIKFKFIGLTRDNMVQLSHENGETHFASCLLFNKDFKFENEDFVLKRVLKEKNNGN